MSFYNSVCTMLVTTDCSVVVYRLKDMYPLV